MSKNYKRSFSWHFPAYGWVRHLICNNVVHLNTQPLPKIFKESSLQLWPGLLDVDQHVGVGAMPGGHHLFSLPAKIVINCFFFGATGHNIIIKLTPFTITFRINKYNIVSTMVISTENKKKIQIANKKLFNDISMTDVLF